VSNEPKTVPQGDNADSKQPIDVSDKGFNSRAINAGRDPSCASMPIYMANVGKNFYTRHNNPTTTALQRCVKSLEGGAYAESAACGISAITQTFMTLLKQGDRLLTHKCVYDWVDTFVHHQAPRMGIHAGQVDMRDLDALKQELKERPAQVVHFEPLSNPSMDVLDVPEIIRIAHDAGAKVVVDSTWLTPALIRPLEFGADIVVHSLTKYMGGHGDAMGGVIVSDDKQFMGDLAHTKSIFGGTMSPFNAYNILKGIGTLTIRMKQHSENAMKVAEFLNAHPMVKETRYPGLPSDPNHEMAKSLFGASGYSGMVSFVIAGGEAAANTFADSLKLVKRWISLGDLFSLVYVRWPEERKGVPEGYIRVSVGLEDADDIIADLDQALNEAHRE
jgi:methionine-gamma-lyase